VELLDVQRASDGRRRWDRSVCRLSVRTWTVAGATGTDGKWRLVRHGRGMRASRRQPEWEPEPPTRLRSGDWQAGQHRARSPVFPQGADAPPGPIPDPRPRFVAGGPRRGEGRAPVLDSPKSGIGPRSPSDKSGVPAPRNSASLSALGPSFTWH
jgi:hypothetical protein